MQICPKPHKIRVKTVQNIEPQKICQNLLTKEGRGDIIIKLSNESDGTEEGTKFSSKKYLTNERQCDIM